MIENNHTYSEAIFFFTNPLFKILTIPKRVGLMFTFLIFNLEFLDNTVKIIKKAWQYSRYEINLSKIIKRKKEIDL